MMSWTSPCVHPITPTHRAPQVGSAVVGSRSDYSRRRTILASRLIEAQRIWGSRSFIFVNILLTASAGCSTAKDHDAGPVDTVGETSVEAPDGVDHDQDVQAPDISRPDVAAETINDILSLDDSEDGGDEVDGSPDAPETSGCIANPFEFIELPEASGAANLGGGHYLVVADSGHNGRALVIDHATGAATPLMLPLGTGAGDDIEGLEAAPDGRIFGLTSAGFLRAWRVEVTVDGAEAELVLGPVAVSDDAAWACEPLGVNCGPNYEGLCLHPAPSDGECVGWAASKALGELVCLRRSEDAYIVDPTVRRVVLPPDQLSGCAFEPDAPHRLFVAGNVYSSDQLLEVEADRLKPLVIGAANQEAILVLPRSAGANFVPTMAPPELQLLSFGDWQTLGDGRSPRVSIGCF